MPAVTRKGDDDVPHCSSMVRFGCSDNVFCNSIGISRQGDNNTTHLLPCPPICCGHAAPIVTGSSIVFVNSVGCGRIGDPTCTAVAAGSGNVFAG